MAARPTLAFAKNSAASSSDPVVNWLASAVRRLGNRISTLEARSKPDVGLEGKEEVGGTAKA
eukprot:8504219-Alexandrium_andersonii.AAC.1